MLTVLATKPTAQPPNTTEESSQNSDMGDTKSLSPPTSVSEVSAVSLDTEPRTDTENVTSKMDVDLESKNGNELAEERLVDVNQDSTVSDNVTFRLPFKIDSLIKNF